MLKFLRKYNKFILVVFGSLLMVAFLMPQAIQRFGINPKGPVVARMDGRKIRQADLDFASRELAALRSIAPQYTAPGGIFALRDDGNDDAHWFLLTSAAQDAGFIGEVGDGEDWIPQLMQLLAPQIAFGQARQQYGDLATQLWSAPFFAQQRQSLIQSALNELLADRNILAARAAGAGQLTLPELHTALAKARGVLRLLNTYSSIARVSPGRAQITSKQIGDQVIADVLFLPASLLEDSVTAPTEEQLEEHFQRFQETRPADGEFGMGYFLPRRVKLEYLKIDHDAIAVAVTLDPIAVRQRWQRNQDRFGDDFQTAKANVEFQIRDEMADEITAKAERAVKADTFRAINELEKDGKFRVLPADWDQRRPTMEQIAQAVAEQVQREVRAEGQADFVMPLPEVNILAAKWYTARDLRQEFALATATVAIANRPVPISQLVFVVREFDQDQEFGLQVGLPAVSLPARDAADNRYYFTVLAARDESPADSLDDVRDQAVDDYTALQAYEQLAAKLDEYKQLAVAEDLQAVSDLFEKTIEPVAPDPALEEPSTEDPAPEVQAPDGLPAETPQPQDPAEGQPAENTPAEDAPLAEDADQPAPDEEPTETTVPGPLVLEEITIGDPLLVASSLGPADDPAFRDALLDLAKSMDPTVEPEQIDPAEAIVAMPLPGRLGVALGRVLLPRPLTIEFYRALQADAARKLITDEFIELADTDTYPYSYEHLARRYKWVPTRPINRPDDAPADDLDDDAPGSQSAPPDGG